MENAKLKQLPLGISDFKKIIDGQFVYVDKTQPIYQLVTSGQYYFLSRPRRFGKSLLVSTLAELFSGNKDLFKNLWIGASDWQWQKYPVIKIDFSVVDYSSGDRLEKSLLKLLHTIAQNYEVTLAVTESPKDLFGELIDKLSVKNNVILLVDEYDKPIVDNIYDRQKAEKQRIILQNFYSTIKAKDAQLRFVLLTGVSKFAKMSIFSGINNLTDISMDMRYATMLGYTHHELIHYFSAEIARLAKKQKTQYEETVQKLIDYYDGYQFVEGADRVFNPYSILLCYNQDKYKNYWFETGTPAFLAELLKSGNYDLRSIDRPELSESELGTLEIDDIPLATLLFQTGYLTIKSYDISTQNYTLDFPNNEVTSAFSFLMTKTFAKLTNKQTREYAKTIAQALREHDLEKFRFELQDLVDTSPYVLQPKQELHLQMTLYTIGRLIGLQTQSEVMTSTGRADLIMTLPDIIYIIELKINQTAQIALQQILDKRYHAGYVGGKQQVELVGVNFDTETKIVTLVHQPV